VRAAVERTLSEPGAAVVVSARSKLAYEGGMELRLEGHVDFATDRCRLDGPLGAVICDGSVQYSQLDNGRWIRQGEPGRWSNVSPRWGLELLARCVRDERETAPRHFDVDFDPECAAAMTHAGLAAVWALAGEAELDEQGRISHIGVRLEAPDAALDWAIDFADFGPPAPIALPPETAVVELAAHVAELRELGDQPPGA
jgi:hypothetical protein